MKNITADRPEFVVIHAPYGRDAAMICEVLRHAGLSAGAVETIETLCKEIESGVGVSVVSDQALTKSNVTQLADSIARQPSWSDFPLIVTTSGEATSDSASRLALLAPLGNISLLERPLRKVTLVSAVQTALRARRRQYQLRDNFVERERLVRELERSNSELEEFPHVVSHDLQASIRMVKSFADLLARHSDQQLDEKGKQYINYVQKGALQMDDLVKSLLQYATVGQDATAHQEVNLATIVNEVCILLRPSIEEAEAEILCGPLTFVFGDSIQLQRVIQNLISNALKYRQASSAPKITISCETDGQFCRVFVSDNGPGIPAKHHERIFQPLKRLHGNEIEGTGMGLAVCRKIVERHGGQIWVESEAGTGARFVFTLPAQRKRA
jgi:signal transduction histidine kinase